ncbi:MAG: DHA2 family efflux MFS transporter permease subunit [Betaproteobacteria bacterium]|nr:DHA2 family efflux MFS transporter permease subunit [Betaproteobacteria bacterium]
MLCTIGLALATFMQVLDTTIANVSLPTIAGNLGVSTTQSTWVITAFAVSNAIALPLTGWLARRVGDVKLFVSATLLFTLASFLCGVAQSMGMLVSFRALQGFVAGPMYPITQALLLSIFPANRRTQALALLGTVTVVAPIAGPILGGWITDNYSWPWIFFINVPIGIFAAAVVWGQMHHKPARIERPKMDYVGLITLVIGVGALQIVLDKGNEEDWFSSDFIVWMSIISAIALAVFLIWEWTDKDPIVNLRLFRHRNFSAGTLALMLAYGSFFSAALIVPQWLQIQLHYTAVWSGLAAAPIGVLPVLLTPIVGKYANRFDLRLLASVAFAVLAFTSFMRSGFTTQVDFRSVAYVQLIQGLGVAFFFMPVLTILLSDLRQDEIPGGSGLATFLRTLAGSFSASITTYLWNVRAVQHHAQLTERFTPFDPVTQEAIQSLGHGKIEAAAAMLDQMITQQAYQISFNEIFHGLGWMFLSLIVVVYLAKPPFMGKGAGDSAAGAH